MAPYVTLTKHENIGYIEFFNPPHNALPPSLLAELCVLIEAAGEDAQIHVIVLKSGADRAFCAGASFHDMVAITTEAEGKAFFMGFANVINALRKCPKITIGRFCLYIQYIKGYSLPITSRYDYPLGYLNLNLSLYLSL